jgi:hypothetical protein
MTYVVGMASYRGVCDTEGCNKQRWKQGLCQPCARDNGLMEYPECGAEGCTRRGRTTRQGSLCRVHRVAADDNAEKCQSEGCLTPIQKRGLCRRHLTEQNRLAATGQISCGVEHCPNRAYSSRFCTKHFYDRNACLRPNCRQPGVNNGHCERHQEPVGEGSCEKQRCPSPRYKANLCYRHYQATQLAKCGYPACGFRVTEGYCRVHDIGLDFLAGDWFDEVAVDRLYWGRHAARKPTVPELQAVLERAEREGVGYGTLASQMRVGDVKLRQWRDAIARLEAVTQVVAVA